MKTTTKSVIKLSELPKHLQESEIFIGHKIHTFAEFHIGNFERDELTLWLIEKYPTIKMKVSFLIHIDIEKQQQDYCDEEVKRLAFKFYLEMSKQMNVPDNLITENYTNVDEWFEKLNPIKEYYEQMDKEVHFNRGDLNK